MADAARNSDEQLVNSTSRRLKHWLAGHQRVLAFVLFVWSLRYGYRLRSFGVGEARISLRRRNQDRVILLGRQHVQYIPDLVKDFDTYFDAVSDHACVEGFRIADYSVRRAHAVTGWSWTRIDYPGLPEPYVTAEQYLALTKPRKGMTVLDLGAYSGLSALAFQEVVGASGTVLAVEADPLNYDCVEANFARYRKLRGYSPELILAAAWSSDGTVDFSSEGSLGSAVFEVIPRVSEANTSVPSMTLSTLVKKFEIASVDIIKADIEGAEFQAFSDAGFFVQHRPVVVLEPAMDGQFETSETALRDLFEGYNYSVSTKAQSGSRLPLMLAVPN